jgi:nucleoside 2-deoxyribosyltransferase
MKIYLAGPDVFRPDAAEYGEHLRQLCASRGFVGLYPLDASLDPALHGVAAAAAICQANLALIDQADLVMANLNPFRGHEPDSGTAFEVGYAHARGKPVWAYTGQTLPLAEQVLGQSAQGELRHVDANGYTIENFGLSLNLMLACSVTIVAGDADACLQRIAARLNVPAQHQRAG